MARNARTQTKNCAEIWCSNFLVTRSGFAASVFSKAIRYFGGLVLSALLGVSAPALAQTAPTLDANGWTVFTPVSGTGSCSNGSYTGTCIIYVSSSTGNDSNSGLTVSTPVKTLDKGITLLRNGHPDWLLLKRGDTFTPDVIGNSFGVFSLSGQSATAPMVIGSYDPSQPGVVDPYVAGARPLILSSNNGGTVGAAFQTQNGAGGDFIALVGVEFYNYTADPSNASYNSNFGDVAGLYLMNPVTWWLIEDCKFSFYAGNISVNIYFSSTGVAGAGVENPASLFTMNRNVVVDAYSTNSSEFSEGLYIAGIPNLAFNQNLFDHNGWNATVAGAGASIFNRNIYIQANQPSISGTSNPTLSYTNNISTRSSAEGAHFRFGGVITNNLWAYDPIGFDIGCTTNDEPYCVPITSASMTGNVIQSSTDINPNNQRGIGFIAYNSQKSGIQFTSNVVSQVATTYQYATAIETDPNTTGIGITNNVIYDWPNAFSDDGSGDTTGPNAINLTGYPNPNVTIATYDAAVLGGPGTFADFIAQARLQSKANGWNTALTASAVNSYIQAGFGITSSSSTTPTTSSSSTTPTTSSSSTTPPSVPSGLAGAVASATQINLSWQTSTDSAGVVGGYNVFRNGNKVGTSTSTSYQDTGLSAATTYTYAVSAYNTAGNTSAQSSSISVSTSATTPTPPTVAITAPANGTVLRRNTNLNVATTASDSSSAIASITIRAGSQTLKTCTNATSCSASLSAWDIPRGTLVITATASDKAGQNTSTSVTVVSLR